MENKTIAFLREHTFSTTLCLLCAVLAIEVFLLSSENRRLKEALAAEGSTEQGGPERPRIEVGDSFAPFLLERNGSPESIEFHGDGRLTLLLVFAEQCPACPVVVPYWEAIATELSEAGHRTLAIQLDQDRPASLLDHSSIPTYAFASLLPEHFEKLTTVPLTVLVDGSGAVIWRHYGELGPQHQTELSALAATG